ncbi:hypothetical protein D3C73_1119440 [compost metagenome]
MGDFGKIIDHFEKFADYPSYEGDEQPLHRGDHPIIAFEAGIINSGYVALVLEAVTRLHTEHAFDLLKRTKNFIAFASTDNDYISYSLIMRKTIHENQLYEVFPDLKDYDVQFHKWVDQFRHLPASDALDYLQETFLHNYYLDLPFSLIRSEYDVFQQLEHLGNTLADECLKQLHNLANIEELNQNESSLGYCYIEALFFSGELTPEQKNSCSQLYNIFLDKNEVYIARELNLLIEQMN